LWNIEEKKSREDKTRSEYKKVQRITQGKLNKIWNKIMGVQVEVLRTGGKQRADNVGQWRSATEQEGGTVAKACVG